MTESTGELSEHRHPPITRQLSAFLRDFADAISVTNLIMEFAAHSKQARSALLKFESYLANDEAGREKAESELGVAGPVERSVEGLKPSLFEMVFVRVVDNFLVYIAEMLAEIFRIKPETLRSGEMVKIEFVLQHSTMDDLVAAVAEREVERLSYQGMRELAADLEKRMGLSLFVSKEDLEEASKFIEIRNLIVHNRGVVNRRFLSRVKDGVYSQGAKLVVTGNQLSAAVHSLEQFAFDIDRRAAQKFGIPTEPPL